MMMVVATSSVWVTAVGCGLMAGVYFTFSTFVMASLGAIPGPQGIAAMQSINRVILSSAFMPLFFGTSLASLALSVWGVSRLGEAGGMALAAGGVVYVLGMFACTAAFNVPLNNALDAVDPTTPEAASLWARYLRDWTRWNHVRTVSSLSSCALFLWAAGRLV
ncbi:MAG: DUF1772 domain-containing protein [Sandaracinaceae bacterium]